MMVLLLRSCRKDTTFFPCLTLPIARRIKHLERRFFCLHCVECRVDGMWGDARSQFISALYHQKWIEEGRVPSLHSASH